MAQWFLTKVHVQQLFNKRCRLSGSNWCSWMCSLLRREKIRTKIFTPAAAAHLTRLLLLMYYTHCRLISISAVFLILLPIHITHSHCIFKSKGLHWILCLLQHSNTNWAKSVNSSVDRTASNALIGKEFSHISAALWLQYRGFRYTITVQNAALKSFDSLFVVEIETSKARCQEGTIFTYSHSTKEYKTCWNKRHL